MYVYLTKGVYLVCRVSANVSAPHRLCNVMTEKATARKDRQRYGAALKVKPDVFLSKYLWRVLAERINLVCRTLQSCVHTFPQSEKAAARKDTQTEGRRSRQL